MLLSLRADRFRDALALLRVVAGPSGSGQCLQQPKAPGATGRTNGIAADMAYYGVKRKVEGNVVKRD